MIDIDIRRAENVFVLRPQGAISADDFKSVASTIDGYINEHDAVPRLVFRLDELPHWKDLEAMIAHFHLVKDHHKVIPKVAIVSDSSALALLRPVVDLFTGAKIRRFPAAALDDALKRGSHGRRPSRQFHCHGRSAVRCRRHRRPRPHQFRRLS